MTTARLPRLEIPNMAAAVVRIGLFIIVLLASGLAAAAEPQANDEAETLIRRGIELRKGRDDEGAARLFQKAYDLSHRPRAAAQLGLCEQALGRWELAEIHVLEALRAPGDPWVSKNRPALDEAMARIGEHIGRVEVIGDPAGAEVLVNGQAVGKLPLRDPVHVSAGQVDIELRAPGYVSGQRTLTLVGGQYQQVVLRLNKEGAAPGAAPVARVVDPVPAATPPTPPANAASPGAEVSPAPAADDGGTSPYTIAKWSVAGGTGVALAVGIAASIVHEKKQSSFDGHANCADKGGQAVHVNDGSAAPECQGDLNAYHTARTWQIVGFVGAGALAATWLVMTLVEPRPATAAQQARAPLCTPSLQQGGNGLAVNCALRF